jgi:MFS family permease
MAARDATRGWRHFQLLLLSISVWAAVYGRFTLGPLQEAMQANLGLSDSQIAWLQGPAVAVPMALGSVPLGLLIDRYPRLWVFISFATLNLLACVLTAFATHIVALYIGRCLAGLSLAGVLVAVYSMVGDLYGPLQRGRATMVVMLGEIGGAPTAFALGGMLLGSIGSETEGWRDALLWMCVPFVPVLLLMLALREPPRGTSVQRLSIRERWPQFWGYRKIVLSLLLARVMVWTADGAVLVWGAPVFSRTYGMAPEHIGAIMGSALLISGILGPVLGGPLADLCQRGGGPRRTMAALSILALLSAPAALFAILPNATLASVSLTAFLTLGFAIGAIAAALTIVVLPSELRALFVAVTIMVGALFAIGIAPLTVSGLSLLLGGPATIGRALMIVCVGTSILGAVVFAIGRVHFPGVPGNMTPATATRSTLKTF